MEVINYLDSAQSYNSGDYRKVYFYPGEYNVHGLSGVNISFNPGSNTFTKQNKIYDHLGSVRSVFDTDLNIMSQNDYMPFGEKLFSEGKDERSAYVGKENDNESDLADHGVRKLDYLTGRFTAPDKLWEKYIDKSPYHYSSNNPVNSLDINGMDEEQREQALEKAEEYKESESTYDLGAKGEPGEPVDCSGMVSECVKAGGEEDPASIPPGTGVQRIENNTQKVEDINDVEPGNIVTFRTGGSWGFHTGIVKEIETNDDGDPVSFTYIHANSSNNGVTESTMDFDNKKVHGFYKWDTLPEVEKSSIPTTTIENINISPPRL